MKPYICEEIEALKWSSGDHASLLNASLKITVLYISLRIILVLARGPSNGMASIQTNWRWWIISPAQVRGHNGRFIEPQYLYELKHGMRVSPLLFCIVAQLKDLSLMIWGNEEGCKELVGLVIEDKVRGTLQVKQANFNFIAYLQTYAYMQCLAANMQTIMARWWE